MAQAWFIRPAPCGRANAGSLADMSLRHSRPFHTRPISYLSKFKGDGSSASCALQRKCRRGLFLEIGMVMTIAFLELFDGHSEESGGLPSVGA